MLRCDRDVARSAWCCYQPLLPEAQPKVPGVVQVRVTVPVAVLVIVNALFVFEIDRTMYAVAELETTDGVALPLPIAGSMAWRAPSVAV